MSTKANTLDPWEHWPASEDKTAVDVVRVLAQDPVQAIPIIVNNNPGAVAANYATAMGIGYGSATTPRKIISDLADMWQEGQQKEVQDILAVQWVPGADTEQDKAVAQLRAQYTMPDAGLGQLWAKLLAVGTQDGATVTTTTTDTPPAANNRGKLIRYALIGMAALATIGIAVYLFKKLRS